MLSLGSLLGCWRRSVAAEDGEQEECVRSRLLLQVYDAFIGQAQTEAWRYIETTETYILRYGMSTYYLLI